METEDFQDLKIDADNILAAYCNTFDESQKYEALQDAIKFIKKLKQLIAEEQDPELKSLYENIIEKIEHKVIFRAQTPILGKSYQQIPQELPRSATPTSWKKRRKVKRVHRRNERRNKYIN